MNAKQTAMQLYGLDEWPGTHIRTRVACDVRSQACWILKRKGLTLGQIALALGYSDGTSVRTSLNRFQREGVKQ